MKAKYGMLVFKWIASYMKACINSNEKKEFKMADKAVTLESKAWKVRERCMIAVQKVEEMAEKKIDKVQQKKTMIMEKADEYSKEVEQAKRFKDKIEAFLND